MAVPLALVMVGAVVVPVVVSDGAGKAVRGQPSAAGGVPTATRTPAPPDRDIEAVTVALRAIDPCLLADVDLARSLGLTAAATIPAGPHSCLLVPDADYDIGDETVEFKVGTGSDQAARWFGAPTVIGGAKAYLHWWSDQWSGCRVVLPVSGIRAIELSYEVRETGRDVCPFLRRFAESAVAKLRTPDAVAMAPDSRRRPFALWDGCVLLATVLGSDADDYLYRVDDTGIDRDPLAGCRTYAGDGADHGADHGADLGPSLEIHYGPVPEPRSATETIAGRTVELGSGEDCTATWDHGPSGNSSPWFSSTIVKVTARTGCDAARQLVKELVARATQSPLDADAAPQWPLLFEPGDDDTFSRGACVDLVVDRHDDCEPYQRVDVPLGAADIMAAAEVTPHVQCAVFHDAVTRVFGAEYEPVVWGEFCFFVAPDHLLEIQVSVAQYPPTDYEDPEFPRSQQWADIAGKPAIVIWNDPHRTNFDIYVSPAGDLSAPGHVHIGLTAGKTRGVDDIHSGETPVTEMQAELAIQVLADVVAKHFL